MKRLILIAGVGVLLSCATPEPREQHYLRTDGHNIVDAEGNRVFLRAVGLGNWLLPEGYMWKFGRDGDRPRKIEALIQQLIGEENANAFWESFRRYYITEADIARIKELGFNTVRPAMNWRLFMDEDTGDFQQEGFDLIDNLVEWCQVHEVYIILEMHAAPGGQTGANIDDSANNFPELFTNDTYQEWFVDLWVEFAKRYRDEPIIIAYDLLNEPLPNEFNIYFDRLEPLYKRTVAAIRQVDEHHMITLEGAHWSTDFSIFGPPFDDNVFYQFHKYWSLPDTKSIQQYIAFRNAHDVPLFLGESGENDLDWYWAAYDLFENHNIGWLFWPWKKMDTENTPYSIQKPEDWDKIADFSRGGPQPDAETAQRILDQFLENIKLQNCEFFPEVVNAIFRRVPVRIQAEHYGHLGSGTSFSVQDTTFRAEDYRINEPVPIVTLEPDTTDNWRRDSSKYAVVLNEGEWLQYEIHSTKDQILKLLVKVRARSENPAMHFELDGEPLELSRNYSQKQFYYNHSNPITITQGQHDLRLVVDCGSVVVDWFDIK